MAGFNDLVTQLGEAHLYEDIYMKAGASWEIGWFLIDNDESPIDLTACTVRCELRPAYTVTPIFTFATSGATGTISQTAGGYLALLAAPSATAPLATAAAVRCLYDVKLTSSAGRVIYLSTGNFYIFPEVTI